MTFALAVVVLPLNFGLGLIAFGLVILPVLVLHLAIGLALGHIKKHKILVIFSAINLLVFALIRPDGVHAFTDNGLSALLEIFDVHAGYDRRYENTFFVGSATLLLVQVIIDLRLRNLRMRNANE